MSTQDLRQPHQYVDSDQLLTEICQELAKSPQLGFDSEFIRTDTFFPKPGLYQLVDGQQTYLIDPLTISDWTTFKLLFADEKRVVIMHSCGEDLGLLRHSLDTLP
ncbi:MAG: ribonuclease D, partial [Gammaproteobacteria bacterium]|nr:ribonuclease D [Gammaproteobacteria bacterium]